MSEKAGRLALAVETDRNWRSLFSHVLYKAGVESHEVTNADSAIAELASDRFKGVITGDLGGRWADIAAAAQQTETGVFVVSDMYATLVDAMNAGHTVFTPFQIMKERQRVVHEIAAKLPRQ